MLGAQEPNLTVSNKEYACPDCGIVRAQCDIDAFRRMLLQRSTGRRERGIDMIIATYKSSTRCCRRKEGNNKGILRSEGASTDEAGQEHIYTGGAYSRSPYFK